jgi:hypothetical protein
VFTSRGWAAEKIKVSPLVGVPAEPQLALSFQLPELPAPDQLKVAAEILEPQSPALIAITATQFENVVSQGRERDFEFIGDLLMAEDTYFAPFQGRLTSISDHVCQKGVQDKFLLRCCAAARMRRSIGCGTPHSCGSEEFCPAPAKEGINSRLFIIVVLAGVEDAEVIGAIYPLSVAVAEIHTGVVLAIRFFCRRSGEVLEHVAGGG